MYLGKPQVEHVRRFAPRTTAHPTRAKIRSDITLWRDDFDSVGEETSQHIDNEHRIVIPVEFTYVNQ